MVIFFLTDILKFLHPWWKLKVNKEAAPWKKGVHKKRWAVSQTASGKYNGNEQVRYHLE
jgi:hypothetical protein